MTKILDSQVTRLELTHELPENFQPREQYPKRGPLSIAEALRPFVKDKVFCDLGCGAGDILELLVPYAEKVIGLERSGLRNELARGRSFELRTGNFFVEIPDADVYYNWSIRSHAVHLTEKLYGKKTLFIGGRRSAEHFSVLNEMVEDMKVFEFDYQEELAEGYHHYKESVPDPLFPNTWWIALI